MYNHSKRRDLYNRFLEYVYLIIRWMFRIIIKKPYYFYSLIKNKSLWDHPSYYPEKTRKSKYRILLDQIKCILFYGMPNKYYFMYGQDVKFGNDYSNYVQYIPFSERRDKLNLMNNNGSLCLLRNKFFFGALCDKLGICSPENIAIVNGNSVFDINRRCTIDLYTFVNRKNEDFFCKQIDGECGRGIFILKIKEGVAIIDEKHFSIDELITMINGATYLFQKKIVQHDEVNLLYRNSINTIRLVTVRNLKTGKITVFPSIIRVGANGNEVDNTSQGGIAVGFDLDTGQLHKFGFYKPQFGLKIEKHPNSGVVFENFKIPYILQAKEQAMLLHSMLTDIHSIGWDIAIGKNGPIFIEGNDNWEINGPQVGNYGLKKEFQENFF